jgi:hypothetical protein
MNFSVGIAFAMGRKIYILQALQKYVLVNIVGLVTETNELQYWYR